MKRLLVDRVAPLLGVSASALRMSEAGSLLLNPKALAPVSEHLGPMSLQGLSLVVIVTQATQHFLGDKTQFLQVLQQFANQVHPLRPLVEATHALPVGLEHKALRARVKESDLVAAFEQLLLHPPGFSEDNISSVALRIDSVVAARPELVPVVEKLTEGLELL
jgi:hypothetical protein